MPWNLPLTVKELKTCHFHPSANLPSGALLCFIHWFLPLDVAPLPQNLWTLREMQNAALCIFLLKYLPYMKLLIWGVTSSSVFSFFLTTARGGVLITQNDLNATNYFEGSAKVHPSCFHHARYCFASSLHVNHPENNCLNLHNRW